MKVEIIDLKRFKLIAENELESIILNEWTNETFTYEGGKTTEGISENTYRRCS